MQNNIAQNITYYENREKPEKHTKYKTEKNHLSNREEQIKDYDYYVCDYCESQIKILENGKNVDGTNIATGGIAKFPISLTRAKSTVQLALCNKCVKAVIQQFEEQNMIKDNAKHIPVSESLLHENKI